MIGRVDALRRFERFVFNHRASVATLYTGMLCLTAFLISERLALRETPTPPATLPSAIPEAGEPREDYRGLPPPEFRGEWTGTIRFVDDVKKYCGPDAYACASPRGITMPNPCTPDQVAEVGWHYADGALKMLGGPYSWDVEEYRTTMCHELGHAHGWPGSHWIASETEIAQIADEMVDELYERDQDYGAIARKHLVGWHDYGLKGEAAVAKLIAEKAVVEDRFNDNYSEIRLTRCRYWTLREQREGDGAKKMKRECPQ